ncbi:MAG TPA: DUF2207 domain-containing protein [bacterium]|nr:DUF2207 domain-containing protein [bacterium]HPL95613.1 DUF2207 domain-containing protein [bacterium]
MKKIKAALFLVLALIMFLPNSLQAEQINSFQTEIKIQRDGSLVVKEVIVYDFGISLRHGIYRNIPYRYQNKYGQRNLDIKVLTVTNWDGEPINYLTSIIEGEIYSIKIGDVNKTVNGEKVYVITYRVEGALNYFEDHDELYWNVTGNDWQVNMRGTIKAQIELPNNFSEQDEINYNCYTGIKGAQEKDCQVEWAENKLEISYTKLELIAGQGLTVAVGWPKGLVNQPSQTDKIWKVIKDNGIVLLPILIFIGLYLYWRRYGRDPEGQGTIVPEYEPPKGMLPAEGEVVYKEAADTPGITATIIDLARRGYLILKEKDDKVLGLKISNDWQLIKTENNNGLIGFEEKLFKAIFQEKKEMLLSELKSEFEITHQIRTVKEDICQLAAEKKWFVKNPQKARLKFTVISVLILFALFFPFYLFLILNPGILTIGSFIITVLLIVFWGALMPKRTKEGVLMKEKLEGFKLFLSMTEKDRVKFHFSPSAHPEKFAEYLPWAIIFGVEKEWAEVFRGIDLPQPDWYEGKWTGNFTALALANSLGSFSNSLGGIVHGASAASGGSGLSGGGFSGGGFGGGGGGSW